MRSIIQWLRLVAPPAWVLGGAISFSIICTGLYLVCGWRFDSWDMTRQFLVPREAAVGLAAAAIGVLRVTTKHPLYQSIYCSWLALTPWDRSKPLPLGPIALLPQDAVIVGLLMLLVAFRPLAHPAIIPLVFLCGYLAALALALAVTGQRPAAFAILFGLGLTVRVGWWSPWGALACAAGAYFVACAGLWRSLADFPWRNAAGVTPRVQLILKTIDWMQDLGLGEMPTLWPYNLLHYKGNARSISRFDAIAIAFLVGWWAYALFSPFIETEPMGWLLYCGLLGICVGGRLIVYLGGHAPPISEWGRLWTLRWIIPAYDRVFVVPALALFVGAVMPGLRLLGIPGGIVIGVASTTVLLLTLLGPPRLREWQLTAPVRLVSWPRHRQLVQEI